MDPSILINWTITFPNLGVSGVHFNSCFTFDKNFMLATSVDPDQMPHCAVSDLGVHCLPWSQKRDPRLIWLNNFPCFPVKGGSRNFERGVHKILGSRITVFRR